MRYEAPRKLKRAVALLSAESGVARVLAGGTDLLVQLRSERIEPDLILDIKRIESMHAIAAERGGYRIGAAVSCAALGEHAGVKQLWPGVVEAATLIGSTQVQGRATMAGNLCNASPAADAAPALIAAGATVAIAGPGGRREVPAEAICLAPGRNALEKGEIVESLYLPARPERSGDAYLRLIPRSEMDIAVVSAGVSLSLDAAGRCSAARVALGAVAPRPLRVEAAAAALIGSDLDEAVLAVLAAACAAACDPIDDKRGTVEYRTEVAGVLAKRAAVIAQTRAGGAA